jgi:hypothetical protein
MIIIAVGDASPRVLLSCGDTGWIGKAPWVESSTPAPDMEPARDLERHEGVRKTLALAGVLLVLVLPVSACTATGDRTAPAPSAARPSPEPGCAAQVHQDQLPDWARAGFSGDARAIYAVSRSGQMVAVLFGYPLSQPPAKDRNNKILWVSGPASATPRDPSAAPGSDDLVIDARLDGRGEPVQRRIVGGPGPSIVDLPAPGCWRLALSWSGRTDVIDLDYGPPR